eukprot:3398979-Rhodomonas_salina.1
MVPKTVSLSSPTSDPTWYQPNRPQYHALGSSLAYTGTRLRVVRVQRDLQCQYNTCASTRLSTRTSPGLSL